MAYYTQLHPRVYHLYSNCTVGNNMVKGNLVEGTPPIVVDGNTLDLCETCADLDVNGEGIPGIPDLPDTRPGARVKTYYSKKCPQIFHICQNCFLGQNIEKQNLVKNKPPVVSKGKKPRLCRVCTRVCITGKCKIGTPKPAGL
jgi:hypothetical protein